MKEFLKKYGLIAIMLIMFFSGVAYLKSDHNPFLGATLCTFGIGIWLIVQIIMAIKHTFWRVLFIATVCILFIIGISKGLGWM